MSTGLELSEPTHFSPRAAFQPALHPGVTSPGWSPRTVDGITSHPDGPEETFGHV